MIRFGPALVVMLGAAHASLAEGFPALYDVTGVAAGDVLNIRAAASASAPLVGALHRQATGVEVVAVEGAWAVVAAGEASGYAALRYLVRQPVADWYTLHGPITCHGTEPFWTLRLDPAGAAVAFSTPEAGFESLMQPSNGDDERLIGLTWSGWRDLNPRPLVPQTSALPSCATARNSLQP